MRFLVVMACLLALACALPHRLRADSSDYTNYTDFPPGPYNGYCGVGPTVEGKTWIQEFGIPYNRLVARMNIWSDSNGVNGLQVQYTDDYVSPTYGTSKGDPAEFILNDGELITGLEMWGNGKGQYLGRIQITTTVRVWSAGKDVSNQFTYACPTGSGVLTGFYGQTDGSKILNLAFLFLLPLQTMQFTNLVFNIKNNITSIISPIQKSGILQYNSPVRWQCSYSEDVIQTHTYTHSITTQISASVTVSAGFFGLGTAVTSSWSQESTSTHEMKTTETRTLSVFTSGTTDGKQGLSCLTSYDTGLLDLYWTGDLNITFQDRSIPFILLHLTNGKYTGVVTSYMRIDLSNAGGGGQVPIYGVVPARNVRIV